MHSPKHAAGRRRAVVQDSQAPSRKFSSEIHGIRGLALTMVVAFHLFGHGRVSGGVDVFLVISAYLMTGSMIRSISGGRLSLVHRYGKTFSRLLPPALVTIVSTAALGLLVLPRSQLLGMFEGARSSAIFLENIYLGTAGLTYEAAGETASPFQHFWSLSAQGQFLILWPLVAFLVIRFAGRLRPKRRLQIFLGITIVMSIASFAYAMWLVSVDQPVAYYSLGARLWEFGAGAMAAAVVPHARRLPAPLLGGLGWLGMSLVFSSGFVTDGGSQFPGAWALWPVTGAVLILISADTGGAAKVGLTRVLSWKPIAWLANRGYPLYLWHWPLLVYFLTVLGESSIGYAGAALVLAVSLFLSEISIRFVSAPTTRLANAALRTAKGSVRLLASLVTAALAVAATMQVGVHFEQDRIQEELSKLQEAAKDAESSVAPVITGNDGETILPPPSAEGTWIPDASVAKKDLPTIYSEGCVQNTRDVPESALVLVCPDVPGPDAIAVPTNANRPKVVMGGGSHVMHYYPAIRQIADQEGWELIVIDKDGCRLAVDNPDPNQTSSCRKWNEDVIDVILAQEPDAVITLGSLTNGDPETPESVPESQVKAWKELSDAGVPVVVMRDTPRFPFQVPECVLTEDDPLACSVPTETVYSEADIFSTIGLPDTVVTVDVTDRFCDATACPPVIGNILVYRDNSHMTATFSKTLGAPIKEQLKQSLPALFSD